jgi:hypothetical protein
MSEPAKIKATFSPEEWKGFVEMLDHALEVMNDKGESSPTAEGFRALMVICRERRQHHIGAALAAMLTILSKGGDRMLLHALNDIAGDCSPPKTSRSARPRTGGQRS